MNEDLEVGQSQEVSSSSVSAAPESVSQPEAAVTQTEGASEGNTEEKFYKSQDEVDKFVSQRIEREKRKIRAEYERQYGTTHQPQAYAQNYQQPVDQSYSNTQSHTQQIPQDVYQTVAQIAQQSYQQQKVFEERKMMLNEFMQTRAEEEAKNPEFADFSDDMEKRCSEAMLYTAVKLKDPTILYRIHKESPEEFKRILRLDPEQQALKVAEYRGRFQAPTPKVVSSAPPPVEAPKATGSSYQKPLEEMSVRERLDMRRKEQRARMNAR